MSKLNDLKGKRFGRLMVLKREPTRYSPNGTYRTMWKCACDCGNKVSVVSSNLTRKDRPNTQSCGCLQQDAVRSKQWDSVEYRRYQKNNIRQRNLSFKLTKKDFVTLIISNCFYCGQRPIIRTHVGGRLRNGIDRIDSKKGYVKSNCVTCCSKCNTMKRSMSINEFLSHLKTITSFQKKRLLQ